MPLLIIFIVFIVSPFYSNTYTVKKNDSLWEIARNNKISISDLKKLNDLSREMIFEKQRLYIPTSFTNYTVKAGDTFVDIANNFGTEVRYIITLNNISENYVIEGQTLRVPISDTPKKASKSTTTTITKPTIKTDPIYYKVKRGDTLSDVALKYKTTVPKLRELNKKSSSSIYIGEQLIVGNRVVPQIPSNTVKSVYVVKNGDTLGQIAINHGVPSKSILAWNNKKSSSIYVNEKLVIYTTKKPQAVPKTSNIKTIEYTVRRGDNLSYIAAKFGTSPSAIRRFNNKKTDKLLVGETLKIAVKVVKNTTPPSPKMQLVRYNVKRGDTLDDIAIKYKVRRSEILSWNNKRSTRIYIGESLKIYVPVKASTPKASKKAEYIKRSSGTGKTSANFKDVPLPVKYANIVSASTSGRGVDLMLDKKISIEAPKAAKVQHAGYIKALRNVVILQLDGDRTIVYAGLDRLNVKTGQEIKEGYLLGSVGVNTIDKKPKLYLEMRDKNQVVNILGSYKELQKKQK